MHQNDIRDKYIAGKLKGCNLQMCDLASGGYENYLCIWVVAMSQ